MSANGRPIGHDGIHEVPLPLEVHTQEQLDQYLTAVSQGVGLDLAASQIGSTSTQMRRLLARDPEWQAKLDAAILQGKEHYADRLKATARVIALRTDPAEVIPRILEVELATHVPGYEHLRRDRVKHEGQIAHTISFDPAQLEKLSDVQLAALEEALLAMGAETVEGEATELRELPAA